MFRSFVQTFTRGKRYVHNHPSNRISDLIDGYRRSKVLFTAVDLKLFDHLAERSLTLNELLKKLDLSHSTALQRFLNACIGLELIEYDPDQQRYSNTNLSREYLVSSNPKTLNGYINHNNQSSYLIWHNLSKAIRDNSPQWKRIFETIKEDQFTFNTHYRDEQAEEIFMSGMHGFGFVSFPLIVESFRNQLKSFENFCDLGGATGCLAMSMAQINDKIECLVFDLPQIEKHWKKYLDPSFQHRIQFQSGDFFRDQLPKADLYGLGRILHDWTDEQGEVLLKKIYQRLPVDRGGILIAEKLLNEDKHGPVSALMQDMNMLVATVGHERSASEYEELLRKVGFRKIFVNHTRTYLDGILAFK